MKKIIFYINKLKLIVLVFGILGVSISCEELDKLPEGTLLPNVYFETQADAMAVLTAVYNPQHGNTQRYYTKSWIVITDITSDDMGDGFGGFADRKELDRFKFNTSFPDFAYVWWNAYRITNRGGFLIDNVLEMSDNAFDSPELKKRIIAEARFLRAHSYFHLVRLWGDVPFHGDHYVGDPVGASESGRTDIETIYDFIVSELILAEADLWDRDLVEKGRVSKGAAQALLSKVYLTRAGWRLDSQSEQMVQGSSDNWSKAAEWAKKLMDEGNYDLMTNYREVFPAHEDDYDLYENNQEHIYFLNCTENNHWFETKLYFGPRMSNNSGGYSSFVGEVELTSSFESGDLREEVTNLTYIVDPLEEEYQLDESDASFWWPGMAIPHIGKYLPDEEEYAYPPSGNASGTNYPLFRYAEVLLIFAEARNEASGPDAESIEAFNKVRRRAGLSEWPNVNDLDGIPYPNNQDGFRQAIRQERRWELCYEGKRIFDLLRWGNLVETFQARAAAPDATVQDGIRAQNIGLRHNLFPIPYSEIQVNPNLTQNPGY